MHFIWNLLDLEIQLYFCLFIFILCLLSIYLSFALYPCRSLRLVLLWRLSFFSLFLQNFVCESQIVYVCAHWIFDIHFEKWKMHFCMCVCVYLAVHSILFDSMRFDWIELWTRLLACCSRCNWSTDFLLSLYFANCNIISTKKYCIKSNEWNKCQSAHTSKKVIL